MSDLALLLRLQAQVSTFLAGLPTAHLIALAEGRAVLAVADPAGAGKAGGPAASPTPTPANGAGVARRRGPAPEAGSFDAESVGARLRACETLDEATELLAALSLTAVNLKLVAKALNIPASGTKTDLAKRILTLTVGARSKHAVLRQG